VAEQKRIVAKLGALNAKSARARTELARIETLVSRYKQSVLSKAFSGELTREWRKGHSSTWPWRSVLWSDCGDTLNGRAFPSGDYCDSGMKLLRPGNLGSAGDVSWNEKNTRYLPEKYAAEFPKHFIKGEAILINLTAQSLEDQFLGRTCLSSPSDEFLLNQRIGLFRPTNMTHKFCLFALKSPGFRSFVDNGMNSGSLIQHVHTKQLEQYRFVVPDLEEQDEIVRRIESAFARIDRLAAEARRVLELVGRLDEAILAKAFRGELVPQDGNDEPAENLLERIRAERAAAAKAKRGRGRNDDAM
jgi:type I restriction enzyme S subunit